MLDTHPRILSSVLAGLALVSLLGSTGCNRPGSSTSSPGALGDPPAVASAPGSSSTTSTAYQPVNPSQPATGTTTTTSGTATPGTTGTAGTGQDPSTPPGTVVIIITWNPLQGPLPGQLIPPMPAPEDGPSPLFCPNQKTSSWAGTYNMGEREYPFKAVLVNLGQNRVGGTITESPVPDWASGEEGALQARILEGKYDPKEKSLSFVKQYVGTTVKHQVVYRGYFDRQGILGGKWSIGQSGGFFRMSRG